MDIVIAATLVDTLRYRLYAQTVLLAHAGERAAGARRPLGRDSLAVASQAPPPGMREARRPGRQGRLSEAGCAGGGLPSGEAASVPTAQWSAAVRALRERTYREVLTQVEHFIRTTGRDWQIQALDYGSATTEYADEGGLVGAASRLTLVTEVVLAARVPRLH